MQRFNPIKKVITTLILLIAPTLSTHAQQYGISTEGDRANAALAEVQRVTALMEDMEKRTEDVDTSDPRAAMELCQKLLPQLDDYYRIMMTYATDAGQRATVQRIYLHTRQMLLDDLVLAQRALARPTP